MPDKPKTIVYLRPDTIGDLILFTPAINLFMAEWPDARHVIVVREGYETLGPLFPKALQWKVARLNPFKQRPSECRKELEALLADLGTLGPSLILAPTLNRTWLELAVASHFKEARSIVLGGAEVDPIFAASLRLDLGVDPAASFKETVPSDKAKGDVENQHRFVETVVGRPLGRVLPKVAVPADASKRAEAVLAKLGLSPGKWAAVFAGGLANVAVKSWPPERFAELVVWLQGKKGIPVLLMAHVSEAPILEQVAVKAAALGGGRPQTWLGKDGELSLLGALLSQAQFYVGHDTGAMHMAGAVGRPAVGIFGGGHWPRFRPSARQAVSVVQPLPCFGCSWDCHFGDGPCVKTIPSSDVVKAVDLILAAGVDPLNKVLESHALPAEALRLIVASTPGILALKRDRVDRQHKIEELKSETDLKDVEIGDLKGAAEERKREMESIKSELELECANKDREIEELKGETNSKDLEISALKDTCNEREQIVVRLDAGLKAHIAASGAREKRIADLESERAALTSRLELFSSLPPDAPDLAQLIRHKDVHIANVEGIVQNREEEIALLRHEIRNYASGFGATEQAKHYGKLLAQKEAVIQELNRACIERSEVIAQLVAQTTGVSALLHKLWVASRASMREKVVRPLRLWTFRRVLEKYWMQIGILRQYEPRPLAWDRRLAKAARPPAGTLPTIAIVTPSYCQPAFLESTILSVLNQGYEKLLYVVQDGGSKDASPEIIARYADKLAHGVSEPDLGQADAVRKGFSRIESRLGPDDVMAYLNSDDLAAPRVFSFVAGYFAAHPEVDVIYGHRIVIDQEDQEVGRWIMPRHEPDSIEWIDYIPQETLYWRKRAWDLAGGIDPSFQFALDWDLLARFHKAGCRIVRVPYFLGCFRVHAKQKTHHAIHTTGADEMQRIRLRFHGEDKDSAATIEWHARRIRYRGALTARLSALGIRW